MKKQFLANETELLKNKRIQEFTGKSNNRRYYFFDLIIEQPEKDRRQITNIILDTVEHLEPDKRKQFVNYSDKFKKFKDHKQQFLKTLGMVDRFFHMEKKQIQLKKILCTNIAYNSNTFAE